MSTMGSAEVGNCDDVVIFRRMHKPQKRKRQSSESQAELVNTGDTDVSSMLKSKKKQKGIFASSKTSTASDAKRKPGIVYEGVSASQLADEDTDEEDGEKVERELEILSGTEAEITSNIYKGIKNYHDPLNESKRASRIRYGPKKGAANIRISCMFDYKPDICKDYKETGYCGYGDSCVFLHDRGDYKTGWQLEKEWEESQKNAREEEESLLTEPPEKKGKAELPFACFICRNPFKTPFKTKCNHYFCEKCIIDWSRKSNRCFSCGTIIDGIIVPAEEILGSSSKES